MTMSAEATQETRQHSAHSLEDILSTSDLTYLMDLHSDGFILISSASPCSKVQLNVFGCEGLDLH